MRNTARVILLCFLLSLLPLTAFCASSKTDTVIRVKLTKPALTNRVEIALDGSYSLGSLCFQRGSHLVVSCATGTLMVYYEGCALDAGKTLTLIRHAAEDGKENGLRLNGAYELYPGDLHLSIQSGYLLPILYTPLEEYLLGVVPYEMSDTFPLEALKAQAVAARTYALYKKSMATADWDVTDNTQDQTYGGVKVENVNAARAVAETNGLCGYYKGRLAICYYSASNGGQTELTETVWGKDGNDYGYLSLRADPYDLENPESTVKRFSLPKKLSSPQELKGLTDPLTKAVGEALNKMHCRAEAGFTLLGIAKAAVHSPLNAEKDCKVMTALSLTVSVRAEMPVQSDDEEVYMFSTPAVTDAPSAGAGYALRETSVTVTLPIFPDIETACDLAISSTAYEVISVAETEDAFVLESRRYGHGVGLSQRGAQWMAEHYGFTTEQILAFYYPGLTFRTVDTAFSLPTAFSAAFLATPGPAATPTPRPTAFPLLSTPAPNEHKVIVSNIGVNSYLNLRASPSTAAGVVSQLYYGQELIVMQDLGDWLMIRANDLTGYVMASFVTLPGQTPAP